MNDDIINKLLTNGKAEMSKTKNFKKYLTCFGRDVIIDESQLRQQKRNSYNVSKKI